MAANKAQYRCSFCKKDENAVKRLVAGPNGVFICDECVTRATATLRADTGSPAESE